LISLELAHEKDFAAWDDFVRSSVYPHFYNELGFVNFYSYKTKGVCPIIFRNDNKVTCVFPGGLIDNQGVLELRSPFSASFGGFSHRADRRLEDLYSCMELLLDFCKRKSVGRVVIQQPPVIYATSPDEVWEHLFDAFGFRMAQAELSYYVELRKDFLEGISASARRTAHKASRSEMVFEEVDDVGRTFDFIARSRDSREIPLSMKKEEILGLAERFRTRLRCYRIALHGETIAATINYLMSPQVALSMFWAHDPSYAKERPLDYLIVSYAEYAHAHGVRYFDFGTTTIGGKPVWGVTEYKEKFSPKGVIRRRFVKEV
jgi:hypothetical protein